MLTPSQLVILKADILVDPALAGFPNNADGNAAIAALYAVIAVPDFWAWRTFVPDAEIYEVPSVDGTSWSWTGNGSAAPARPRRPPLPGRGSCT